MLLPSKVTFSSSGNLFSMNLSFWLMETFCLVETVCFNSELFLCCWKSLLKLEGTNLKEKHFLLVEIVFFYFLARRNTVFRYGGNVFLTNTSSQVVRTDFLASTNHFYIFLQDSCEWKPIFRLVETFFSTNFLFPLLENYSSR